jgi:hypothetical protein
VYPFSDEHIFVRNCWYVAAIAADLDQNPIERTLPRPGWDPIARCKLVRVSRGKVVRSC